MRKAANAISMLGAATALLPIFASPAFATCPIEKAVYRDRDGIAEIRFMPVTDSFAVTNQFQMVFDGAPPFKGIVLWTQNPARPNGMVMHACPEGDLTGEEIDACTVWKGPIYALDGEGMAGLIPAEGQPAPQGLLLTDFGYQLVGAAAFELLNLNTLPWDGFKLTGCQE